MEQVSEHIYRIKTNLPKHLYTSLCSTLQQVCFSISTSFSIDNHWVQFSDKLLELLPATSTNTF